MIGNQQSTNNNNQQVVCPTCWVPQRPGTPAEVSYDPEPVNYEETGSKTISHVIDITGRTRENKRQTKRLTWTVGVTVILVLGRLFLYKTEKLSSDFSRTQIPKIFKNSVYARKLSSIKAKTQFSGNS